MLHESVFIEILYHISVRPSKLVISCSGDCCLGLQGFTDCSSTDVSVLLQKGTRYDFPSDITLIKLQLSKVIDEF